MGASVIRQQKKPRSILGNTCLLANSPVSQESLTQYLSSHRNDKVEGEAFLGEAFA